EGYRGFSDPPPISETAQRSCVWGGATATERDHHHPIALHRTAGHWQVWRWTPPVRSSESGEMFGLRRSYALPVAHPGHEKEELSRSTPVCRERSRGRGARRLPSRVGRCRS